MADKELAAKLARRLEAQHETDDEPKPATSEPPPVPVIPQNIVPNPHVAADNSVNIDDLILNTLKKQEANNNTTTAGPSSPMISPRPLDSNGNVTQSPMSPPPKTTIRNLLERDYQNNPTNVQAAPSRPVVGIVHHKKEDRPSTPTRQKSPEDGSELERKLEAQRRKKTQVTEESNQVAKKEEIPVNRSVAEAKECVALPEAPPAPAPVIDEVPSAVPSVETEFVPEPAPRINAAVPTKPSEIPIVAVPESFEQLIARPRKSSFEELEEMFEKEAKEEEERLKVLAAAQSDEKFPEKQHDSHPEAIPDQEQIVSPVEEPKSIDEPVVAPVEATETLDESTHVSKVEPTDSTGAEQVEVSPVQETGSMDNVAETPSNGVQGESNSHEQPVVEVKSEEHQQDSAETVTSKELKKESEANVDAAETKVEHETQPNAVIPSEIPKTQDEVDATKIDQLSEEPTDKVVETPSNDVQDESNSQVGAAVPEVKSVEFQQVPDETVTSEEFTNESEADVEPEVSKAVDETQPDVISAEISKRQNEATVIKTDQVSEEATEKVVETSSNNVQAEPDSLVNQPLVEVKSVENQQVPDENFTAEELKKESEAVVEAVSEVEDQNQQDAVIPSESPKTQDKVAPIRTEQLVKDAQPDDLTQTSTSEIAAEPAIEAQAEIPEPSQVPTSEASINEAPLVQDASPVDVDAAIQQSLSAPSSETPENDMSSSSKPKALVPSPLLIEAIRIECGGLKSPPPLPPPKPQTPTHSRPQSPAIFKKAPVSPAMSSTSTEGQHSITSTSKKSADADSSDELSEMLERRQKIMEGDAVPERINRKLSLYAEFSEFSRKQIKFFTETFTKYDEDRDGFIDFNELKRMMEKLGEAQTHIALKQIIQKVDEDKDGKISLREFLLLFRLAAEGHFGCSEVFTQLAGSVDVSKEGVLGAASFFQAKIAEQTKLSKFEEEIKQEQDERKKEEEERKQRREKFLQSKSLFH